MPRWPYERHTTPFVDSVLEAVIDQGQQAASRQEGAMRRVLICIGVRPKWPGKMGSQKKNVGREAWESKRKERIGKPSGSPQPLPFFFAVADLDTSST